MPSSTRTILPAVKQEKSDSMILVNHTSTIVKRGNLLPLIKTDYTDETQKKDTNCYYFLYFTQLISNKGLQH